MAAEPSGATGAAAELVTELEGELATVGGRLHRAGSLADARQLVRELIGAGSVSAWEEEVLEGAFDPAAAAPAADAEVSLIVADVAIAGTGQIGFAHRAGRPRATGLLPERQVVMLAADDVVSELREAFARMFGGDAAPGNVVLVGGPSRTADIEQRSIRGVHSPRELDVVVYPR